MSKVTTVNIVKGKHYTLWINGVSHELIYRGTVYVNIGTYMLKRGYVWVFEMPIDDNGTNVDVCLSCNEVKNLIEEL